MEKFNSKELFTSDSQEYELKEKLLDFVQKLLLQYSINNDNNGTELTIDDAISIDKKLLLVVTNILISSFSKNKLSLDFSILKNENENGENQVDQNFDFASTQTHKQKIIDLNKIIFVYLRVS